MLRSTLAADLLRLYQTVIEAFTSGANLEGSARAWEIMVERIRSQEALGRMSAYELELAATLATNVKILVEQALQEESNGSERLEKLSSDLDLIILSDESRE